MQTCRSTTTKGSVYCRAGGEEDVMYPLRAPPPPADACRCLPVSLLQQLLPPLLLLPPPLLLPAHKPSKHVPHCSHYPPGLR